NFYDLAYSSFTGDTQGGLWVVRSIRDGRDTLNHPTLMRLSPSGAPDSLFETGVSFRATVPASAYDLAVSMTPETQVIIVGVIPRVRFALKFSSANDALTSNQALSVKLGSTRLSVSSSAVGSLISTATGGLTRLDLTFSPAQPLRSSLFYFNDLQVGS